MKALVSALGKALGIILFVAVLGGGGWGLWQWARGGKDGPAYRTDRAVRGNLVATINATGTIEPEEVIDVGAQVAGQILRFGPDPRDSARTIDYGSPVEQGTVLAQIDDALYAPEVAIARADLAQSVADVRRGEADLLQARAKLFQAERDWARAKKLGPNNSMAQADIDTYQSAYDAARAAVPGAQAAVEKAKSAVERARGTLTKAEKNLGYCTIRSPVKGVIIDRRVNVGQTVVSSLNAPSLFLIAKDLRRLQVWASVNEADIGNIHPGQHASFVVDAYPADVFSGVVGQIRLNATMTQNVVTYTVVVNVDNEDGKLQPYVKNPAAATPKSPQAEAGAGKLLPYLTANLQFKVDERANALLVPNAALRYRPRPEQVAPEFRDAFEQAQRRKQAAEEAKAESGGDRKARRTTRATVWAEDGGYVRPVALRIGMTDGTMTEVVEVLKGGDLEPDTPLVTGEEQVPGTHAGTVNPFAPTPLQRRK